MLTVRSSLVTALLALVLLAAVATLPGGSPAQTAQTHVRTV